MSRMTLARRVTVLVAAAVTVAVGATILAAFLVIRHQLLASVDESVRTRAETALQNSIRNGKITWQEDPSTGLLGAADICAQLRDASGRVVQEVPARCGLRGGAPERAVATGRSDSATRTVSSNDGNYRMVTLPLPNREGSFSLAQSLEPTENVLTTLGWTTVLVGAIGVVGAALAGMAVARSGLRPVRRLTERAEEIARTDRLLPIEVTGDDEIARLSRAFNEMLAAVAASRERQRQLVADAGHELRTPLTSLRTNLDLMAQADQRGGMDPAAREELLTAVRAQAVELSTLVQDLVELARDEPIEHHPEQLELADLVHGAVERVRRRAPDVAFDVRTEPWAVVGESQSLQRAVINLLDNAVKWSPEGGTVTVLLRDGKLDVYDQGPGLSEEDLPHVFDRFYRASDARRLPGSGLGLAIVRQAAERHGGRVLAGHAPGGGAAFRLILPGRAPQPADEPADDHPADRSAGAQR